MPSEAENSESFSKPTEAIRNDGNPKITDDLVADDGPDSRVHEPVPGPSGGKEGNSMDHGEIREAPAVRTYRSDEAIDRRDETGVLFVDVREVHEVAGGIVPGALHIPLERVVPAIDPASPHYNAAFDDVTEVLFYCRSGRRSAVAAQRATEMGIDHVAHVKGGICAWADAGGPVQAVRAQDRCINPDLMLDPHWY